MALGQRLCYLLLKKHRTRKQCEQLVPSFPRAVYHHVNRTDDSACDHFDEKRPTGSPANPLHLPTTLRTPALMAGAWRRSKFHKCPHNQRHAGSLNGINVPTVDRIVDMNSPKFHKSSTTSSFQPVESKDALKGSAPAPKTVSGLARKCPIFNGFCFIEIWAAC